MQMLSMEVQNACEGNGKTGNGGIDCYAAETMIRMADGSCRRADQIRMGDRIMGFDGKFPVVSNILTGWESEIYHIRTQDGNGIRVTGDHIMQVLDPSLPEGKCVPVKNLNAGDALMTVSGSSKVVSISVERYENRVFSFLLDGQNIPHYIEANGYWTGDFEVQNMYQDK